MLLIKLKRLKVPNNKKVTEQNKLKKSYFKL